MLQKAVAAALSSFTAAPLTDTEQARRANQLLRFVALIAVEYDHGVEDGRVTIPFEIQEGLAFSKAARAAFMDLQGTLTQLDRRATVASAGARARSTPSCAGRRLAPARCHP